MVDTYNNPPAEVVVADTSVAVPSEWSDAEWNALLSHRPGVLDCWLTHRSSADVLAVLARIPRREEDIGGSLFTAFSRSDLDWAIWCLIPYRREKDRSS